MHQIRIDVQEGHNQVATESKARLKRGRPISSKDKIPRILKKDANKSVDEGILDMVDPKMDKLKSHGRGWGNHKKMVVPKVPNNEAWDAKPQGTEGHNETSISYVMSEEQMEQEKESRHWWYICMQYSTWDYEMNEDHEPTSIHECTQQIRLDQMERGRGVKFIKKREVLVP